MAPGGLGLQNAESFKTGPKLSIEPGAAFKIKPNVQRKFLVETKKYGHFGDEAFRSPFYRKSPPPTHSNSAAYETISVSFHVDMTRIGPGPCNYQMARRPFPISEIKSAVICHNVCMYAWADETFLIQFLHGFEPGVRMLRGMSQGKRADNSRV